MNMSDEDKPATTGDLRELREDLSTLIGKVDGNRGAINALASEVVRLRETVATKADFDRAQSNHERMFRTALDAAESCKIARDKAITHGPQLMDHEDKLRDHERRLNAIESRRPL